MRYFALVVLLVLSFSLSGECQKSCVENRWSSFADFLFWRAEEGKTEWASVDTRLLSPGVFALDYKEVNFNWEPGFRTGIGYFMDRDQWDLQLYYTWCHSHEQQSFDFPGASPIFTLITFDLLQVFQSAAINWMIQFNMFDLELGRSYPVSSCLSLRPHVGVKGGWINQRVHGHFQNTQSVGRLGYRYKNDFWGVGPSGGFNTKWEIGHLCSSTFSLLGDFAGALMWGHFNIAGSNSHPSVGTLRFQGLSRDLAASMLQTFLGFGWDRPLSCGCDFAMKLGYELQYWFRQNQLFFPHLTLRYDADLSFQGGVLEAKINF